MFFMFLKYIPKKLLSNPRGLIYLISRIVKFSLQLNKVIKKTRSKNNKMKKTKI